MIDLTIKTLDSRNHSFSVADDITVKQLKEQIADSVNVSAESQRLIYCGRVLQDDKKLSEYDVNGKVIHLVQRAPPPAGGSSNDGGGANASGGGNRSQPSQIRHRLMRGERRLLDGGNAMYLGAMAIPTDFMESQGMTISQPTRVLVQSRLTAAGQMLTDAAAILNELENPSANTRPRLDNVSPPQETATPGTNSGSNQVSGSIAAAAQVATAAAIAAAVSANIPNASDLLNLVADEGDDQSSPEEAAAAAAAPTPSGAAAAAVAADAAQQSADAATAGAASAAGATAGAASVDANHVSSTTPDQPGRRRDGNSNHFAEDVVGGSRRPHLRPSAMARVMESLADVNRRLQPFMERVQTIMRDDPVLESPEETQRMYKRVSEVMHYLSHAYHALSDIMCDFSRPPPRVLRCRPVLIQHSAVVQTEIPIQAQINVRTNNSLLRQMQAQQSNAGSQTSAAAAADDAAANSTPSTAATSSQRTTNTSTANAQTSTANVASGNTANAQTNTRGGLPNVWLRGGLPSGVPGSGLSGANEGASGQQGRNITAPMVSRPVGKTLGLFLCRGEKSDVWKEQIDNVKEIGGKDAGRLIEVLEENKAVFSDQPGKVANFECKLQVREGVQFCRRSYSVPQSVKAAVAREVKSMLENDIIELGESEFSSPLVVVPKKDGSVRLCLDARQLFFVTLYSFPTLLSILIAYSIDVSYFFVTVVGGSIPWGATAQNPGDFIQSLMQALTGQLVGATTSPTGTPATGASATGTTTGTTAGTTTGTTSGTTGGTGAQASQARGNTATHPTTSTQTRSTARPHVHFGTSMPGLGSNDFDPYLPCNSHHVTRRNQQRRARAATIPAFNPAGPNSSSNSQSAASSSAGGDRASTNGSEASQTAAGGGRLPSSEVLMNLSLLVLENLNRQYGGGARPSNASAASSGARSEGATAAGSPVLGGSVMRPVVEISSGIVPINHLIPLLAGAGHGLFAAATGTGHPLQFQNLLSAGPHATLASLLPPDMVDPQNPPESILADLFVTLAANLTLADLAAMAMDSHQLSATSGLQQARPALQRVVRTRLLRNQPLNETTATRATEIINAEIRPHLEVMLRELNLREDIDVVATISQLNHRLFPRMLSAIMEGSNFQTAIVVECYMYVRHICAIMEYCCAQVAQGMDHIIRRILDNVALGVPGASRTIESLWRFLARTTLMSDDDIQRFIVYRRPDVQRGADTETPSDAAGAAAPEQQQPMEVEVDSGVAGSREGGAVAAPSQEAVSASAPPPTSAPVPAPATDIVPQVEVASDALPDVIIGSETWHSSLPSDWVPIITRDTQRQRRQSSQPPFSDAYLSGMPSKRRKIITAAKPQGSLSQVISENMQTAVSLAGVVAPGVETATVAQDASGDASLRLAYRDEVRSSVRRSLQSHPDYSPDKYPNAAKYFDAK
ncbi:large proline-rich protein BAG6 [Nilaparvata lugens]|uniref:large proline-rich protein BAG6 n=1 Tax=Nilaparvata lugens TaxID=108931 RepID=UPI00193E5EFE|nr:large proline-rich protein BAG6 [Nilaparvata lugens]